MLFPRSLSLGMDSKQKFACLFDRCVRHVCSKRVFDTSTLGVSLNRDGNTWDQFYGSNALADSAEADTFSIGLIAKLLLYHFDHPSPPHRSLLLFTSRKAARVLGLMQLLGLQRGH